MTPAATPTSNPHRFKTRLGIVLAVGAVLRTAYLAAQPASDPLWNRPILDGQIYLDWARQLIAGGGAPEGAFYHSPLYPYLLAGLFAIVGEQFTVLYGLQQLLMLAAAALAASVVRQFADDTSAIASAALFLLYAPTTYFASRPLAESLTLFLMFAALAAYVRPGLQTGATAGMLMGCAIAARANLLLLIPVWVAHDLAQRRFRRAAVLIGGVLLVIAPITVRNRLASGHWVPVAANAGLTAFHGNGPGAVGIFTQPPHFSGDPARQSEEAVTLARRASGQDLDAVEADRYWGRQALQTRLDAPLDTLQLGIRRMMLTLDSYEHGLDYPPAMDRNPWRLTLRLPRDAEIGIVPLGLLIGLAAAGGISAGRARSGGWLVWGSVAACLATPILFYVSSRYRLPAAALLTLPAGVGWVRLGLAGRVARLQSQGAAAAAPGWTWLVTAGLCALSLLVPSQPLQRVERAASLSNLATGWLRAGDGARAITTAREAIALQPDRAVSRYNLGFILHSEGNMTAAELAYRQALERDPALVPAAHALALLLIADGRAAQAIGTLRHTMLRSPACAPCWSDMVLAQLALGDVAAARRATVDAGRLGVTINPDVAQRLAAAEGAP